MEGIIIPKIDHYKLLDCLNTKNKGMKLNNIKSRNIYFLYPIGYKKYINYIVTTSIPMEDIFI